jgi:hypothetical protein
MTDTEKIGASANAPVQLAVDKDDEIDPFDKWMENIVNRIAEATNKLVTQIATAKTGGDTLDETTNKNNVLLRERSANTIAKATHAAAELNNLKSSLDKAGLTKKSKKVVNAQKKVERAVAAIEAACRAKGLLRSVPN